MTAYDKALSLLAVREHNRKELSDKLISKGFDPSEISSALARLEREGYLSDRRFCQSYIRSRLRKNPEGKQLLIMRLIQKGVDRTTAREETELYFRENSEAIDEIYSSYAEKLTKQKGEEKARQTLIRKNIKTVDIE
ncbi:MAG: regulatory protein RecX [Bullifex sp.]